MCASEVEALQATQDCSTLFHKLLLGSMGVLWGGRVLSTLRKSTTEYQYTCGLGLDYPHRAQWPFITHSEWHHQGGCTGLNSWGLCVPCSDTVRPWACLSALGKLDLATWGERNVQIHFSWPLLFKGALSFYQPPFYLPSPFWASWILSLTHNLCSLWWTPGFPVVGPPLNHLSDFCGSSLSAMKHPVSITYNTFSAISFNFKVYHFFLSQLYTHTSTWACWNPINRISITEC